MIYSNNHILAIEDDPDYRLILTRFLVLIGFAEEHVKCAASLKTGLQLIKEHSFDLVLLDITLPDASGVTGLEEIMQIDNTMPVIILTGMENNQLAREAIATGAQDYLLKSEFQAHVLERSIAYSLERSRLTRELKSARNRLTGAIIAGQEQERQRIAQDIHDGLGQMLAATSIMVNSLSDKGELPEWCKQLPGISERALREYRAIINNLRPPSLEEAGLVSAMEEYCQKANDIFEPDISFTSALSFVDINTNEQTELYRIVQELVNNALKHSGAKRIGVMLNLQTNQLVLSVTDDGCGFEVESTELKRGIGLKNLHVRTQLLNATYQINSRQGAGTAIIIQVPI